MTTSGFSSTGFAFLNVGLYSFGMELIGIYVFPSTLNVLRGPGVFGFITVLLIFSVGLTWWTGM